MTPAPDHTIIIHSGDLVFLTHSSSRSPTLHFDPDAQLAADRVSCCEQLAGPLALDQVDGLLGMLTMSPLPLMHFYEWLPHTGLCSRHALLNYGNAVSYQQIKP